MFYLKQEILIFQTTFAQKGYFQLKIEKNEYYHRIHYIQISLNLKFHFKQTTLIFLAIFAQKG